jgi:hypothetical protein
LSGLNKMNISMPKATTDRTNGGRELMARGERAVPLVRRPDDEAGAAPGGGEGSAEEGGDGAAQCLNERSVSYEGDSSRRRPVCAGFRK